MSKSSSLAGGLARTALGFIPPGMTLKQYRLYRKGIEEEAFDAINRMKERGMIREDEDPRAEEALEFAIGVVRDQYRGMDAKLKAARMVLDFTKRKPVARQEVLNKAEDFLEELANEDD